MLNNMLGDYHGTR